VIVFEIHVRPFKSLSELLCPVCLCSLLHNLVLVFQNESSRQWIDDLLVQLLDIMDVRLDVDLVSRLQHADHWQKTEVPESHHHAL